MNWDVYTAWLMLRAIANFEGYFQPGSRANRNNNPGNLRNWDPSLPKDDQGFDVFPTLEAGVSALWRQIWKNVFRGVTLKEFFVGKPGIYAGYAPLSDHNSLEYPRYVAQVTGIPYDSVSLQQFLTA